MTEDVESLTRKRLQVYEKQLESWNELFAKKDQKKPYYPSTEQHELNKWVVKRICRLQFEIEDLRQTYVKQQTEDIVDDSAKSLSEDSNAPKKAFKEIVWECLDSQKGTTTEQICAKSELGPDIVQNALTGLSREGRAFETKPGLWLRP